MATNTEYEFVEKLPEDLTCSICSNAIFQPYLMNCCEQQFCKSCLERWLKRNKSCPNCRSSEFEKVLLKQKSRRVGELKVYCPNKTQGCQTIVKISEYENHLSETNAEGCLYVKLSCPNECTDLVFHGKLKHHVEMSCPRRQIKCTYCETEGEHQFITGKHVNTCPSYPLPCSLKCGATVLRKDLETHKDTCPQEIVPCPYSELGCKVRVCRKDLERHIESSALQHMTELAKSHLALKDEHAALKAENITLNKQLTQVNFKLNAVGKLAQTVEQAQQKKAAQGEKLLSQELSKHFSKMYSLLVDTSDIRLGKPLTLRLSEANQNSGYHYFKLLRCKFKLKWEPVTFIEENKDLPIMRTQVEIFLDAYVALPDNWSFK